LDIQKGSYSENNFKVKFSWNDRSIEWFLDSEKSTEFYKKTMEEIHPFIKSYKTVLDIGCGIGSFAIEFANKGFEVTAIDKSSLAIKTLEDRIKQMNITNIKPMCISFEDFSSYGYDVVFISYMKGLIHENNIDYILKNVKKSVFVLPFTKVKNDFSIDELYMELGIDTKNLAQPNYSSIVNMLDSKNKEYKIKKIKTEFGQYFNTIDEALEFVLHYFDITIEKKDKTKSWLNKKLIKSNGRLYLPSNRESILIII